MGAMRQLPALQRELQETEEERRLVRMRTAAASDGVDAATLSAACEELARSGIVPTAPAILHAMGARPDLKIADIDKHLKVSTHQRARTLRPPAPAACCHRCRTCCSH